MLNRLPTYFMLLLCVLFLPQSGFAQQKKKVKKKNTKQFKEVNIIQKGWGDVTTRNNWYFNANERYKEVLRQNALNYQIDFSQMLPFYLHNKDNLNTYSSELQTIEQKMGIVLQIRNYSRWRDNAYLLMGKAQYFQNKIDTSFIAFQYIVTTMKPEKLNAQVGLSNKARMKYLQQRAKELRKKTQEKQKLIEFNLNLKKKESEKKSEDLREKQKEAVANRQKEIEQIIKAKKKVIALQKKGKKVPPDLLAKARAKTTAIDTTAMVEETPPEPPKEEEKPPEIDRKQPYILIDDEWVKNPYYVDTASNRDQDSVLQDLTEKENEDWNKLTFWEKIKHKQSRPEALVWMARSLTDMERYADAQSMIAYTKALRKLTNKQKKDVFLVNSYYHLTRKNVPLAIQELENAMLYLKKKQEKAYYEFVLAQLYQQNTQPADAVDYFEKAVKHTNDDRFAFYAKLKMVAIFADYPELSDENIEKMLLKLVRFGKNKDQADEVYYALANYALNNLSDTAAAIKHLEKSVQVSTVNTTQKGLSYLMLGKIHFDAEKYTSARFDYDSTIAFLPEEHTEYPEAALRQSVLEDLANYRQTIEEQDSLQRLGKMSPQDLEQYLAEISLAKEKELKKKSRISIEENEGASGAFDAPGFEAVSYTANGLWYFYNNDIKNKGYTQFKSIWGNRQLEPNWRRSSKSIFEMEDMNADNTSDTEQTEDAEATEKQTAEAKEKELKIPQTPEDFIASDKLIADALYNIGVIFKNKLQNIPRAKQAFDELIRRFPNSEFDAIAHYYLYLIYMEQDLEDLAEQEKNYILENYPLSDVAEKLQNMREKPELIAVTQPAERIDLHVLYTKTYEAFLRDDSATVVNNRIIAIGNQTPDSEMAQFDWLEAMIYGKHKNFKSYKYALSDMVLKYPGTEIKQKAQNYLMALIQYENDLKDSTKKAKEPEETDTVATKKIDFEADSTDFLIVVRLNDAYFKLQKVVVDLQGYCEAKASGKVRVNPVFFENKETFVTLKRFDDFASANKLLQNLNTDKEKLFAEKAGFVVYYIISSDNFKLIKSFADLDIYEKFYMKNYGKGE